MSEVHDDEFDAYLDGRSPLSRRYAELGDEKPPPELDAQILATAAQAAKVVPLERPTRRWGAALAVAATLVLCVSLVMNLTITPSGPLDDGSPAVVEFAEPEQVPRRKSNAGPPAADESRAEFDALRRQALPAAAPDQGSSMNDMMPGGPAPDAARPDLSAPAETGRRPELAAPVLGQAGAIETFSRDEPTTPDAPAREELSAAIQVIRAFVSKPAAAAIAGKVEAEVDSRVAARAAEKEASVGPEQQRLGEILVAFDAGDRAQAATLLDRFVAEFPDHPVSRQLTAGR